MRCSANSFSGVGKQIIITLVTVTAFVYLIFIYTGVHIGGSKRTEGKYEHSRSSKESLSLKGYSKSVIAQQLQGGPNTGVKELNGGQVPITGKQTWNMPSRYQLETVSPDNQVNDMDRDTRPKSGREQIDETGKDNSGIIGKFKRFFRVGDDQSETKQNVASIGQTKRMRNGTRRNRKGSSGREDIHSDKDENDNKAQRTITGDVESSKTENRLNNEDGSINKGQETQSKINSPFIRDDTRTISTLNNVRERTRDKDNNSMSDSQIHANQCVLQTIVPRVSVPNAFFPIVLMINGPVSIDVPRRTFQVCIKGSKPDNMYADCKPCTVRYGRGSVTVSLPSTDIYNVKVTPSNYMSDGQFPCEIMDVSKITVVAMKEDQWDWSPPKRTNQKVFEFIKDVVIISKNITIPKDVKIVLLSAMILVKKHVNIEIKGEMKFVSPSETAPMIITKHPGYKRSWGQIVVWGRAIFQNVYLTKGGHGKTFGHSSSAPVIMAEVSSTVEMLKGGVVQNYGKAFGSKEAKLTLDNILVSRCDTGGEFSKSLVNLTNSYILEMPDDKRKVKDDDNDGMYFLHIHPSGGYSHIHNCVFSVGDDDAIDHNGANLDIRNLIVDNFEHEGLATSSKGQVIVKGAYITNCEQGIEAGYRKPTDNITDVILRGNDINIRYGDDYGWGYKGIMHIKYALSIHANKHSVKVYFKDGNDVVDDVSSEVFSCPCCIDISVYKKMSIIREKVELEKRSEYISDCLHTIRNRLSKYSIFNQGTNILDKFIPTQRGVGANMTLGKMTDTMTDRGQISSRNNISGLREVDKGENKEIEINRNLAEEYHKTANGEYKVGHDLETNGDTYEYGKAVKNKSVVGYKSSAMDKERPYIDRTHQVGEEKKRQDQQTGRIDQAQLQYGKRRRNKVVQTQRSRY